ncbi:hypothetical protein ABRT01_17540 [Lentibacillus sp. L22]
MRANAVCDIDHIGCLIQLAIGLDPADGTGAFAAGEQPEVSRHIAHIRV